MDGVNRISGCYVHSSANEFMHRRAYHLIPNEEEEGKLARARMQLAGENGVPMNADTAAPKNKNGVIKRGVLGKEQRTSDWRQVWGGGREIVEGGGPETE